MSNCLKPTVQILQVVLLNNALSLPLVDMKNGPIMVDCEFPAWGYNEVLKGPDSLVVKASALGVGGRRFEPQCRRQWVSF